MIILPKDLAARNIFMDGDELCKVGDFGLLREANALQQISKSKIEEENDNPHSCYKMRVRMEVATVYSLKFWHL